MIPQYGTLRLSRSRLLHNLRLIRAAVGNSTRMCATIKANAYGHGVSEITTMLRAANVEWACVYSLEEAAALAPLDWPKILVLAPLVMTTVNSLSDTIRSLHKKIRVNLTDSVSARHLAHALALAGMQEPMPVHVQIDTGLTRAGVDIAEANLLIAQIQSLSQLHLEGVFAHLSHGDSPHHTTLHEQMTALRRISQPLTLQNPGLLVHLQNSGAAWNLQNEAFDMLRVGIAMYGLQPSTLNPVDGLLPAARLTAPILAIHERPENIGVGYGHTFTTRRNSRIAIVPVGYADGYPRSLSNRAIAQVRDMDAPVIGRVSMDQIIVDLTEIPHAVVGDEVTVISDDPTKANSLDRLADATQTIGYELATHWGPRLHRVIVD